MKWHDPKRMRWLNVGTDFRLISFHLNLVVSIMIMRTKSFDISLPKMELTNWKEIPYWVMLAVLNLIPIIKTELGMWSRSPKLLSSFICSLAAYVINAAERKCQTNSPPHLINRKCRTFSHTPCLWIASFRETHMHRNSRNLFSVKKVQMNDFSTLLIWAVNYPDWWCKLYICHTTIKCHIYSGCAEVSEWTNE